MYQALYERDRSLGADRCRALRRRRRLRPRSDVPQLPEAARNDSGPSVARAAAAVAGRLERIRAREVACYTHITATKGFTVYFCDPHSSWQRGTNEKCNGLLNSTTDRVRHSAGNSPAAALDRLQPAYQRVAVTMFA